LLFLKKHDPFSPNRRQEMPMEKRKVLDEGRQLKRMNAETPIAFWLFFMIRTCVISFSQPAFASSVPSCGLKAANNPAVIVVNGIKNSALKNIPERFHCPFVSFKHSHHKEIPKFDKSVSVLCG